LLYTLNDFPVELVGLRSYAEGMLKGKKTYICCVLAAVASLAAALGFVDGDTREFQAVLTCLFAGAGMSLRLGVANGG